MYKSVSKFIIQRFKATIYCICTRIHHSKFVFIHTRVCSHRNYPSQTSNYLSLIFVSRTISTSLKYHPEHQQPSNIFPMKGEVPLSPINSISERGIGKPLYRLIAPVISRLIARINGGGFQVGDIYFGTIIGKVTTLLSSLNVNQRSGSCFPASIHKIVRWCCFKFPSD